MEEHYRALTTLSPDRDKCVIVVINQPETFLGLLSTGYRTAEMHDAYLVVLATAESPDVWLGIPENYDKSRIIVELFTDLDPAGRMLKIIKKYKPLLLGLPMETDDVSGRYLAGEKFDIIVKQAPCPVYLVKCPKDWTISNSLSAFVPFWDDDNTRFAIDAVLELSPRLKITTGVVVPPSTAAEDLINSEDELCEQTAKWSSTGRLTTKVVQGFDEEQALLNEARKHDFLLLGASRGDIVATILFGETANKLAVAFDGPTIILREYHGRSGATIASVWAQFNRLLPTLDKEDRIEAYRHIRRGARPTRDFFTMTALSAAIASLGLVLDSAAVIIGAMLVAPLMSAIIGMGMAIIHGDMKFLIKTTTAVVKGGVLAILTGLLFGFVNFHDEPTSQILQRTSPSVLDLLVALISGVAAAYALCRKNVSNSLPGVAIAVALVPPLATVGVCLSIGYWGLAAGAFKLFATNLVAIIFASALVFASFGFRPNLKSVKDHRKLKVFGRSFLATGILVTLMMILLVTRTSKEVRQANLQDEVIQEIALYLEELKLPAKVDDLNMTLAGSGTAQFDIQLQSARELQPEEIGSLRQKLSDAIGKPVALHVETYLHSEHNKK